jgi:ABC-type bacteriocin/lantibiotic exporter with double-glycine peptidase domain
MRIPGNITAALGLPRFFVVALSVIVGGECMMMPLPEMRGGTQLSVEGVSSSRDSVARGAMRLSCGPIALKMIFDYYGVDCKLAEITEKIRLTPKGASMLSLKKVAEAKGLRAEGWKMSFDDLKAMRIPVIAYVNKNHFLVVDSISVGEEVHMRDRRGHFTMTKSEFVGSWHGETLVVRK